MSNQWTHVCLFPDGTHWRTFMTSTDQLVLTWTPPLDVFSYDSDIPSEIQIRQFIPREARRDGYEITRILPDWFELIERRSIHEERKELSRKLYNSYVSKVVEAPIDKQWAAAYDFIHGLVSGQWEPDDAK